MSKKVLTSSWWAFSAVVSAIISACFALAAIRLEDGGSEFWLYGSLSFVFYVLIFFAFGKFIKHWRKEEGGN